MTGFAAAMCRFDQQSAGKKRLPISNKEIFPAAAAAFCIDRSAIMCRMIDAC
jgi:hypothetical protein